MKKIFFLVMLLILSSFVSAGWFLPDAPPPNIINESLFCQLNGNCSFNNLFVNNLTVSNLTTSYDYNVTHSICIGTYCITSWDDISNWNRTGTNIFLANTNDNVGIGTITPTDKLAIVGGNLSIDLETDGHILLESGNNKDACLLLHEGFGFGFDICNDGSATNMLRISNHLGNDYLTINRDSGIINFYNHTLFNNNMTVIGNVSADYYYGSGAFLSDLNVTGNTSITDIDITGNVTIGGWLNVTGASSIFAGTLPTEAAIGVDSVRIGNYITPRIILEDGGAVWEIDHSNLAGTSAFRIFTPFDSQLTLTDGRARFYGNVVVDDNITANNFIGNISGAIENTNAPAQCPANTGIVYYNGTNSICTQAIGYLNRSGTNVFLANSGDKVGIGTTSPNEQLHLTGSLQLENNQQIYSKLTTGLQRNLLKYDSSNNLWVGGGTANHYYFGLEGGNRIDVKTFADDRLNFYDSSNNKIFTIEDDGDVNITGDITANGTYHQFGNLIICNNGTIGQSYIGTNYTYAVAQGYCI